MEQTEQSGEMILDPNEIERNDPLAVPQSDRLIKWLNTNKSVPKQLAEDDYWGFASRETALTRLDKEDINRQQIMFDIVAITSRLAKPAYKFNFSDLSNQTNMEALVFMKLCRSRDGFERLMITTQSKSYTTKNLTPPPKKTGILAKLFGAGSPRKQ